MTITTKDIDKMIDIANDQGFIILRIDMSRTEYAEFAADCYKISGSHWKNLLSYKDIPLRIASSSGIVIMREEDIPSIYDIIGYDELFERQRAFSIGIIGQQAPRRY